MGTHCIEAKAAGLGDTADYTVVNSLAYLLSSETNKFVAKEKTHTGPTKCTYG